MRQWACPLDKVITLRTPPHGASLFVFISNFCKFNLQWWSWRPSKASTICYRVEKCNWYNRKNGISFMGLWRKIDLLLLIYNIWFSYYILIGLRMSMNMSFLHRREKKNAGCGKRLHHLAENWWIVEIWKMGRQKWGELNSRNKTRKKKFSKV